jgi:hypothetical protein
MRRALLIGLALALLVACKPTEPTTPTPPPTNTPPAGSARELMPTPPGVNLSGVNVYGCNWGNPYCAVFEGMWATNLSGAGRVTRPGWVDFNPALNAFTVYEPKRCGETPMPWGAYLQASLGCTAQEMKGENTAWMGQIHVSGFWVEAGELLRVKVNLTPFMFVEVPDAWLGAPESTSEVMEDPLWLGRDTTQSLLTDVGAGNAENWWDIALWRILVLPYEPGLPPLCASNWFDGLDVAGHTGEASYRVAWDDYLTFTLDCTPDRSGRATVAFESAVRLPLALSSTYVHSISVVANPG